MVLNLGLVLEKFSGRSTVPEYSWKFEIRAGSNRLYSRFDPVLQNSGFLVHSKFSDFRSELNLELTRYRPTKITLHPYLQRILLIFRIRRARTAYACTRAGIRTFRKYDRVRYRYRYRCTRGMAVYHQDGPNFCRIHAWEAKLSARAQVRIRSTGSKLYGVRYPVLMKYRSFLKRAPISLNHQKYQAWLKWRSDCGFFLPIERRGYGWPINCVDALINSSTKEPDEVQNNCSVLCKKQNCHFRLNVESTGTS